MAALAAGGLSVDLPAGWDGADPDGGAERRAPPRTRPRAPPSTPPRPRPSVLHAASFALPAERGDYGSGAVELMGGSDVLDLPPRARARGGRHRPVPPRRASRGCTPTVFSPQSMQRAMPGMAGAQHFFQVGRPAVLPLRGGRQLDAPGARSCAPRTRSSRPFASTLPLAEGFVPRGVRPYDRPTMSDARPREPTATRGGRWPARTSRAPTPTRSCGRPPRASRCSRSTPPPTSTGIDHVDTHPGRARRSCAGVRATMYAGRPWTIRQYAGFSTAEESNAFYRRNLAAGQQGVSVAFDLATHRGYDSDHPRVVGDVGKAGRGDRLGRGHEDPLRRHPPREDVGVDDDERRRAPGAGQLRRGRRGAGRRARTSSAGPSRTTSSRSSWSATPTSTRPSRACGSWPTSSSTPPSTCRGSTRSRSPATTCRRPARRPTSSWPSRSPTAWSTPASPPTAASTSTSSPPRLSFFFAIGMNFFMEVAKLRAARLLWDRVMASFDPKNPQSLMLRTHCQTSGVSLTEQDPYNNVVRTAVEAHGRGARRHAEPAHQLLRRGARPAHRLLGPHRPQHAAHHPGGDRHPEGRRPARRQLLRRGAHPGARRPGLGDHRGGRGARRHDQGGRRPGMPKLRIEEAAARRQARVDRGEEVIVGVNKYRSRRPRPRRRARHRQHQGARAAGRPPRAGPRHARRRPPATTRSTACATGAAGDGNLLALCIEAARARATVGEMSDAMEAVFGRHKAEIRSITGVYGSAFEGDEDFAAIVADVDGLRRGGGAATAPPDGQDGPGRPRPRRQGGRHRLRRHRLRRRLRPAVRDARGGRPGGGGERRPRRRRVEPGGRAQDPRPAADRRAAPSRRRRHPRRVRRRDPAAGPRRAPRRRRGGHLRTRHQHPDGRRRGARPPPPAPSR